MTTGEIMELDCNDERNVAILQQELQKVGKLSMYAEAGVIPLWAIEKVLSFTDAKYHIYIRDIALCVGAAPKGKSLWRVKIVENDGVQCIDQKSIYAVSIYEAMAKAVIKIQSMVRLKKAKDGNG